jgi:signal transduction histidine kinase
MNTAASVHDSLRLNREHAFTSRRQDVPRLRMRVLPLAGLVLLLAPPLNGIAGPLLAGREWMVLLLWVPVYLLLHDATSPTTDWRRFRIAVTSAGATALVGFILWPYTSGVITIDVGRQWTATLLSLPVFLLLYFATWMAIDGRRVRIAVTLAVAIAVLGSIVVPFNSGGITYVLYATWFAPFLFPPVQAFGYVSGLIGVLAVSSAPFGLSIAQGLQFTLLIVLTGGVSIFYSQYHRRDVKLFLAQEEVEELAALAERERISRDLQICSDTRCRSSR